MLSMIEIWSKCFYEYILSENEEMSSINSWVDLNLAH